MAESGPDMDPLDWSQEYYPILWLPYHVRAEIAKHLDAGSPSGERGIEMFGYYLRFTPQDIRYMRERCRSPDFNYSVTMFLFVELETRRNPPSIQEIYRILLHMRSAAVDIIIRHLPDILRERNRHRSDGQQNSEPSFCECPHCDSLRNRSRHSSGHYHGSDNVPRQSDDPTLCPTNNTRNTRSVQTSYFQDRQPTMQYPQNQPSIGPRPSLYQPGWNTAYPPHVPQQHSNYSYPDNPVNQSGSIRHHSNMQSQPLQHVRPPYQRHMSLQENPQSWIAPELNTIQPLDSSLYSDQLEQVSKSSHQTRFNRSNSEPTHSIRPLNGMAPNSINGRKGNGPERVRYDRNNCQECRLAGDSEQTMVLTPVSEPKSSCPYHSNGRSGHGIPLSETYPQLGAQNVQRSSTIPQNLNSHPNFTGLNPAVRSVIGATMNDNEQTSRKMSYLDDNKQAEREMNAFNETNSNLDADTHETARKTVSISDKSEVVEDRHSSADETKRKTSYFDDIYADTDQTSRKESYLDDVHDNRDETAKKTTYVEDLNAENDQTSRKRSYIDEHLTSNNDETARKTSYIDETYKMQNNLVENDDKFKGLISGCPMCEEENRMRELRVNTFESFNAHNAQSACTCNDGNVNCSANDRNTTRVTQAPGCGQYQNEAQRHVTGESSQECPSRQEPEVVYNRKDGRHSWHEGEQYKSESSLASSNSDSSLLYCRSCDSLQSSESSTKPVVLVTFSVSPDQARADAHMYEVYDLIKRLKEARIRIRVDMDRDAFRRKKWNRLDWLDKNLTKAYFVVACISPEYADDIRPPGDEAVAYVSQLNARYIFDHMRREYYDNRAQNRRLIPVLFPNSGAQYAHVPQCMTATQIYTYSKDVENIIRIIWRRNNFL